MQRRELIADFQDRIPVIPAHIAFLIGSPFRRCLLPSRLHTDEIGADVQLRDRLHRGLRRCPESFILIHIRGNNREHGGAVFLILIHGVGKNSARAKLSIYFVKPGIVRVIPSTVRATVSGVRARLGTVRAK